MGVRRRKRRGGKNMNLQEFKDRLNAQGVSYETFKERIRRTYILWPEPELERFITSSNTFIYIIGAIVWSTTPEGKDFWEAVANETRNSGYKSTRDHAAEAWLRDVVAKHADAKCLGTLPVTLPPIEGFSYQGEPKTPVCECGGEKCRLPHVHWCPMWKEV
jgi:hypothetical protein